MAVQAQASVCACWFAGMARASNSASVPEVVKCIKGNFDSFELVKESDPEKVVALYKDFLVDLLELTSRPLKPLLTKSLLKAFERVPKPDAEFWANQIVAAVQYCRSKSKSITSGQKTSPAVGAVVKLLGKTGSFHLPIWKGATRSPQTKKVKQSPSKVKRKVSAESQTSSSKGRMDTRESILASYGMKFEDSPIAAVSPEKEALVVSSSEEAETPASGSGGSKVVFFDQQLLCMKRVLPGGIVELASMRKGPAGFLEFQWPNSSTWALSEVPNLVLNAPGQEAPAETKAPKAKAKAKAKPKRKAKAKAKALAKAASPVANAAAKAAPVAKAAAKAAASTSESTELVLHNVRLTKASKPPRTYLTACTCGGPGPHKPRLIVEYSEKKDGVNHESKCYKAKEHIISQKLGYSAARNIRNLLPQ